MSIAEFATKRVVATTMIILFMVFSGIIAMFGMKQELLPNFDFPIVAVTTTWTGASPEDVDTQISKKIEDAVLNVDGIKNITMTSGLGYSAVIVEFDFGVDSDIKKVQVQSEIDKIKNTLPTDIDSPIVGSFDSGSVEETLYY
jgi:HAE1 family hydrophobic/amphiphilic exporter-1